MQLLAFFYISLTMAQVDSIASSTITINPAKEAVLVQNSYAGCCSQPSFKCPKCHVQVYDNLKVGNVHYRGNAIFSFDLRNITAKQCTLNLPTSNIKSVGGSTLNIQRSLAPDFNETEVTWSSAPEVGKTVRSFDVYSGPIDLTELCRESSGGMMTFFVTPGTATSIDLPSSASKTPLELKIVT
ncbi:hypothetical protein DSO57_1009596 [Entomophthora muscae]|uniref:Uncharacterized protein n=1 Tax=Entomophthora muscae TaxID=34485 RepID=A0ACC2SK72_9FUNG|nr:hypothetical protein DSO57_1009596 [Entomophthora muscae]